MPLVVAGAILVLVGLLLTPPSTVLLVIGAVLILVGLLSRPRIQGRWWY